MNYKNYCKNQAVTLYAYNCLSIKFYPKSSIPVVTPAF